LAFFFINKENDEMSLELAIEVFRDNFALFLIVSVVASLISGLMFNLYYAGKMKPSEHNTYFDKEADKRPKEAETSKEEIPTEAFIPIEAKNVTTLCVWWVFLSLQETKMQPPHIILSLTPFCVLAIIKLRNKGSLCIGGLT